MSRSLLRWTAGAALSLAVAGCAGPGQQLASAAPSPSPSRDAAAPSGQGTLTASRPSAAAQMICSEEVQDTVAIILGLTSPPAAKAQWNKPVYGCTIHLEQGPLSLSVNELGTDAAALGYFQQLKARFSSDGKPLHMLGNFGIPAFQSADDVVVFVRDDKTLEVDPRSLPQNVGASHRTRRDLAYTVAASILHCWTGG